MVYPITFNSQEDIYNLSLAASKEDYPIYISTENGQIDARSLLALFTIIGKEVKLVAPDHSSSEKFCQFVEKLH